MKTMNDARTNALSCAETVPLDVSRRLGLEICAIPRGPLVYFIRRGDEIKIGFTHRLSQRMKQLGGDELFLIGTVPGSTETERLYHQRFDHLRTQGEWFSATEELLAASEDEARRPGAPTYADVASAHLKRSRSELNCGDSARVFLNTDVGFWLNMLMNGETPERLAGLNDALAAFERYQAA
jgi:hypothetical protein